MTAPRAGRTRAAWTWLLAAALALLLVRLAFSVADFGSRSLQMDFSAFYAAGQAVSADLSPYVNHVDRDPPIWDGVDTYRHSRFLYPPLVAHVFEPFAALPYHVAKHVWMALCLAALGAALWLAARLAGLRAEPRALLALAILAAAYFPLLALLERGQNDSLTLLLLVGAIAWIPGDARRALVAGALVAAATWLKLHCVFLVPFLLARRRFHAVAGFLGASALLLLASLAVDGHASVARYFTTELPRISRYGERGAREMRLPPETLRPVAAALEQGRTVLDGRTYEVDALRFALNASAVRTPLGRAVWSGLRGLGLDVAPAHVSLVFFALALAGLVAWQLRFGAPEGGETSAGELLYWQAVLVAILLCAPATWAMGTVWLLPTAAIVLGQLQRRDGAWRTAWLACCAAGLVVAALPYGAARAVVRPLGERAVDGQYIVAELLCLAGLLGLWAVSAPRSRPSRS